MIGTADSAVPETCLSYTTECAADFKFSYAIKLEINDEFSFHLTTKVKVLSQY